MRLNRRKLVVVQVGIQLQRSLVLIINNVDIRQLRNFLVLAEELHFGRAAQRIHIAQLALSQQLKSMEHELGLCLVDRTNRRVVLTDAGERLVEEATASVARFDQAMSTMSRVRTGAVGRLILGLSPGVDQRMLQDLLSSIAADGDAEVEPRAVAASVDAFSGLERREIDVALVHAVPPQGAFLHLLLASDELGIALPSSHRLACARAVHPTDLNGESMRWLPRRVEPALHDAVFHALMEAGYDSGPERQTPNVETSLSLVAAGLGVSLKLKHEVGRARVGVVWRPLKGVDVTVPTVLVWRKGERAPLIRKLVAGGRQVARQR